MHFRLCVTLRFIIIFSSYVLKSTICFSSTYHHYWAHITCTFPFTNHQGRLLSKMEHSRLRVKYHILIDHTFQMMFVSGETADVAPETTSMIEFIVQQQVMEMVSAHAHMHTITHANTARSSLVRPFWQLDEASAQSAQTTLSSSSDMIELK